jgi:hypothetical protein
MTGTPWHVAVLIGAVLIFAAGLATALRGPDWPVMSARYDAPGARGADGAEAAAPAGARPRDAATMWESLNDGGDPTEDFPTTAAAAQTPGRDEPAAPRERKTNA